MLYGWKENSMLTNCLAACAHLTITLSEIQRDIWYGKTRMVSLPECEKNFEDMFIRFDVIHERDRRTDRRTERWTDGHCMTA